MSPPDCRPFSCLQTTLSHTITVSSRDAAGNTGSASVTFLVVDSTADIHDDTNIYCKGTGTYVVGASSFTNEIYVPTSGNVVLIAAPQTNTTINGTKTIVKGAMDTAVPVNSVLIIVTSGTTTAGYVAQVNGHYFAAKVPIATDTTAMTAIATDQNGGKHQDSVAVTVTAQSNYVDLLGTPSVGIPVQKGADPASLDVSLTATASFSGPVANYAWDFDGSGSEDVTCYSHNDIKASYRQTGLYLAKVSAKDLEGHTYTDTAIVNVVERTEADNLFKAIWNGMKAKLAGSQPDIQGALGYFADSSKTVFNDHFTALAAAGYLPQVVSDMGSFNFAKFISPGVAAGQLLSVSNGKTYYFQVIFTLDNNGNWLIQSF